MTSSAINGLSCPITIVNRYVCWVHIVAGSNSNSAGSFSHQHIVDPDIFGGTREDGHARLTVRRKKDRPLVDPICWIYDFFKANLWNLVDRDQLNISQILILIPKDFPKIFSGKTCPP